MVIPGLELLAHCSACRELYHNIADKYKIQIEAGRVVSGATKSCSRAKIVFELGWDTLEKRRYIHRMVTFFKMVKISLHNTCVTLSHPVSIRLANVTCEITLTSQFQDQGQICITNHLYQQLQGSGIPCLKKSNHQLLCPCLKECSAETSARSPYTSIMVKEKHKYFTNVSS